MIRTSFFQSELQRKRLAKAIKAAKKLDPTTTTADLMRMAIDEWLLKRGF